MAIDVLAQSQDCQGSPLGLAEARRLAAVADASEARGDGVERIGEVAPPRGRVGAVRRKLAARPIPAGERRLRLGDLLGGHPVEEIVLGIMLADVVEAQEEPAARPVEIGRLKRGLELAGRAAAGDRALRLRSLDPAMQFCLFRRHSTPLYKGNERRENRTGRVRDAPKAQLSAVAEPGRTGRRQRAAPRARRLQSSWREPFQPDDRKPGLRRQEPGRAPAPGLCRARRPDARARPCAVDPDDGAGRMIIAALLGLTLLIIEPAAALWQWGNRRPAR